LERDSNHVGHGGQIGWYCRCRCDLQMPTLSVWNELERALESKNLYRFVVLWELVSPCMQGRDDNERIIQVCLTLV
jgi:hypothetical protein